MGNAHLCAWIGFGFPISALDWSSYESASPSVPLKLAPQPAAQAAPMAPYDVVVQVLPMRRPSLGHDAYLYFAAALVLPRDHMLSPHGSA